MKEMMERLAGMAELERELNEQIEKTEAELKKAKAARTELLTVDVPELLKEIGVRSIELVDLNATISVSPDAEVTIRKGSEKEANDWLRANGFGGLIKEEIAFSVPPDAHEQLAVIAAEVEGEGVDVLWREKVHASSLKAFAKEQLAAGETLPEEFFNVSSFQRAKIKRT